MLKKCAAPAVKAAEVFDNQQEIEMRDKAEGFKILYVCLGQILITTYVSSTRKQEKKDVKQKLN